MIMLKYFNKILNVKCLNFKQRGLSLNKPTNRVQNYARRVNFKLLTI